MPELFRVTLDHRIVSRGKPPTRPRREIGALARVALHGRPLQAQHPRMTELEATLLSCPPQVLRSGRALLADFGLQPDQWPEVLSLIQSVLNNSASTRLARRTPMQVFAGRKAQNPPALALAGTAVIPVEYSFAQAQKAAQADELQRRVAEIHKAAAQASTRSRQGAIERHNAKTHINKANFSEDDFVLVAVPKKERRHKMMAIWRGPRRVVK
jgi:hypothetical protein